MKNDFSFFLLRSLGRLLVAVVLVVLFAASASAKGLAPITGKVLASCQLRTVLPMARLGDVRYAEVNSAWLKEYYKAYRKETKAGRGGRSMGDARHSASFYANYAQSKFYTETFHSKVPANTLAVGQIWYRPAAQQARSALVVAFTERGRLFIDPQTGEEVALSPREQMTIEFALI